MPQPANLAGNPVARMQLSEMRGIIIGGIPDSHQLRPGKFVFGKQSVGKRPHWSESYHNIEELKSPREVLYHAPPKEGGEYSNHDMGLHYPAKDKNLLFHQREGILEFPDGKKSTHISEQQSDWISEYEKVNSPTLTDYEGKKYKRKELEVRPMSVVGGGSAEKSWGIFTKSGEEAPDLPTYSSRVEAESVLIPEPISTPPMKDSWWKMGLKDAVKRAVEAGHGHPEALAALRLRGVWREDPHHGVHPHETFRPADDWSTRTVLEYREKARRAPPANKTRPKITP